MIRDYAVPAPLSRLLGAPVVHQDDVRFRPDSWNAALSGVSPGVLDVLVDPTITSPSVRVPGDRVVGRESIHAVLDGVDVDHEVDVLRAFLLVQAWGAGMTGTRTLRHTATAFENSERLRTALSTAIFTLREAKDPAALATAYGEWSCPGVGPSFFTKWFAFAGRRRGRHWQPLILDDRVYRSLNRSLGIRLVDLAGEKSRAARYRAYVEAMHAWARQLDVPADYIEYVLFRDNGKAGQQ